MPSLREDDPDSGQVGIAKLRWRIDALDKWRQEIDGRVAILESKVNDLRFADAVAQALSEKLDQRRRFELTVWQKLGGGLFAAALVVAPTLLAKLFG